MRDPDTGNSKGFAFINYASFEASDAAIEAMNGQHLCNRAVSISYAFKKDVKGERHGSAAERLLAAQNPLSQADRPHQLFADAPPTQMPMMHQMPVPPPPIMQPPMQVPMSMMAQHQMAPPPRIMPWQNQQAPPQPPSYQPPPPPPPSFNNFAPPGFHGGFVPPPPPPPTSTHPLYQTSPPRNEPNRYMASGGEPPRGGFYQTPTEPSKQYPYQGTNPWQREEKEKEAERRREAARMWRDQQMSELVALGQNRTVSQEEQLRALRLEKEFERRAQEEGEDDDDDDQVKLIIFNV